MQKNIICLMGPSAIGKTSLSVKLYKILNIKVINVDSSNIYKEINVGSGKLEKKKLKKIEYSLINILNPEEKYSVFSFCLDAFFLIKIAHFENKTPLLIGGNTMYFFFFKNIF